MRITKYARNIMKCLSRVTLLFSLGIIIVGACYALFSYVSTWLYPEFHGSYNLGSNIYMIDWDGGGRIVVRGSTFEGATCYGGERLIPIYENQYDSLGRIVEYVEDAVSDDSWIIAKTGNKITLKRRYYIIDKREILDEMATEEIVKNRIVIFADSIKFAKYCSCNNINIKW